MGDVLLITGRPGTGKTTLVRRLADDLGRRAGGFYTAEIREGGRRVGFRLRTLEGRAAVFAHEDWAHRVPHRVGRYGVDVTVLDRLGVGAIRRALSRRAVVLVDEIGRMELFSAAFRRVLEQVAAGAPPLVATITSGSHPWADTFKRRERTTIYTLTPATRDDILEASRAWLKTRLAQPST